MTKIIQRPHKTLRMRALPVPVHDIPGAKIKKIISDMKHALSKEPDGVALAAPQINISLRIFVVAPKAYAYAKGLHEKEAADLPLTPEQHTVFINPKLLKKSQKKEWMHEGCLSVRGYYGEVNRAVKASVRAYDETGKPFTTGASGLVAEIFQHELDHLDGVLFADHARNLKKIVEEKK